MISFLLGAIAFRAALPVALPLVEKMADGKPKDILLTILGAGGPGGRPR